MRLLRSRSSHSFLEPRLTLSPSLAAAALFENAYASILRSPPSSSRRTLELRLLRRLEATYCDLELLDNDATPEVVELKSQRIERAVLINDALVALGDGQAQAHDGAESARRAQRNGGEDEGPPGEDDMEGSDQERAEEERGELESSDDDEDEEDRLARRFARAARLG